MVNYQFFSEKTYSTVSDQLLATGVLYSLPLQTTFLSYHYYYLKIN